MEIYGEKGCNEGPLICGRTLKERNSGGKRKKQVEERESAEREIFMARGEKWKGGDCYCNMGTPTKKVRYKKGIKTTWKKGSKRKLQRI